MIKLGRFLMVAKEYYDTLLKITDIMEEKGGGIIYIRNEPDCYTIGTRYYDDDIAEYVYTKYCTPETIKASIKEAIIKLVAEKEK